MKEIILKIQTNLRPNIQILVPWTSTHTDGGVVSSQFAF